jgi:hypothetical protein
VVYVGDSVSDLLPLLKADVGVVIGSNALLRRVTAHFGIQLRPLTQLALAKQLSENGQPVLNPMSRTSVSTDQKVEHGVLYTVEDWREIQELLLPGKCVS